MLNMAWSTCSFSAICCHSAALLLQLPVTSALSATACLSTAQIQAEMPMINKHMIKLQPITRKVYEDLHVLPTLRHSSAGSLRDRHYPA